MKINYSQEEINNLIESLLSEHRGKLKPDEVKWLEFIKQRGKVNQVTRDILIGIYDRIGEPGY